MRGTKNRDTSGSIILVRMEDVVSITSGRIELLPGVHPLVIGGKMATLLHRKAHEQHHTLILSFRGISKETVKMIESVCSLSVFLDSFTRFRAPVRRCSSGIRYSKLQLHYNKREGCYMMMPRKKNNLPRNNI